jgi:VanZ family protein
MFAFFRDSLGLSASAAEIATITVRKTIHLTFYGLMALLALIIGWRISLSRTRSLLFCMLWTLGHAAFDELRQSTTPNRTGTITDVLLDFAGVAVAITIWQRAFRRRIENAQEAL